MSVLKTENSLLPDQAKKKKKTSRKSTPKQNTHMSPFSSLLQPANQCVLARLELVPFLKCDRHSNKAFKAAHMQNTMKGNKFLRV